MWRLSPFNKRRAAAALLALPALLAMVGCTAHSIGRTLPRHITRVYIPMFDSQAFESGIEELATRATVDEFLKDGRVRPVNRGHADLILEGFLTEYTEKTGSDDSDDFELTREVLVRCRVYAYSPEDTAKIRPIYVWNNIEAEITYISDSRFLTETQPPDAKRQVLEQLGKAVVVAVMEGEPATGLAAEEFDKRLDDPGPRYQTVESLRERRLKQRGLPPLRVAF
jgi:hypothetical protein